MNPEANMSSSPEVSQTGVESSVEHAESQTPEQGISDQAEKFEQHSESIPQDNPATATLPPIADAVAPSPSDQTPTDDNKESPASAPATAKHSDQIEREWVSKAKQILNETRDDPHNREERVNALQADYLQKRYNRAIGDGN